MEAKTSVQKKQSFPQTGMARVERKFGLESSCQNQNLVQSLFDVNRRRCDYWDLHPSRNPAEFFKSWWQRYDIYGLRLLFHMCELPKQSFWKQQLLFVTDAFCKQESANIDTWCAQLTVPTASRVWLRLLPWANCSVNDAPSIKGALLLESFGSGNR